MKILCVNAWPKNSDCKFADFFHCVKLATAGIYIMFLTKNQKEHTFRLRYTYRARHTKAETTVTLPQLSLGAPRALIWLIRHVVDNIC